MNLCDKETVKYPKRKHPRLKQYDYSLPGYYYVTIHNEKNAPHLSTVGRGLAPDAAVIRLTSLGKAAQSQLRALEERYPSVCVDKYVIMPNHIHMILRLTGETAGASPRPTLPEIVGTYKSLVTRICNRSDQTPGRKIFQTSFYETVLRDEGMYQDCWRYIEGNPSKWLEEK